MSLSYIMISNWENQEDEDGQHYIREDWGFYLGNDRKAKENWNSYCFSFTDILKYQVNYNYNIIKGWAIIFKT